MGGCLNLFSGVYIGYSQRPMYTPENSVRYRASQDGGLCKNGQRLNVMCRKEDGS
jgi:hypothetical protein